MLRMDLQSRRSFSPAPTSFSASFAATYAFAPRRKKLCGREKLRFFSILTRLPSRSRRSGVDAYRLRTSCAADGVEKETTALPRGGTAEGEGAATLWILPRSF